MLMTRSTNEAAVEDALGRAGLIILKHPPGALSVVVGVEALHDDTATIVGLEVGVSISQVDREGFERLRCWRTRRSSILLPPEHATNDRDMARSKPSIARCELEPQHRRAATTHRPIRSDRAECSP